MPLLGRLGFSVTIIFLWFLSQKFLGRRTLGREPGIQDLIHQKTEKINSYLHKNTKLADILLISSSLIIDGIGGFLMIWSIFGPSIKPLLCLFFIFLLRQINQVMTALPPPQGMIWKNPGFPSFFVTYGVTNDLFFSGHTALATLGALELLSFGNLWLSLLAFTILIYEIVVVLILRAHWTMDVFTGIVTALWAYDLVSHWGS